jgi:hypothetical protein
MAIINQFKLDQPECQFYSVSEWFWYWNVWILSVQCTVNVQYPDVAGYRIIDLRLNRNLISGLQSYNRSSDNRTAYLVHFIYNKNLFIYKMV